MVSFTDDHDASFATLSEHRLATVGRALVDRTAGLGAEPGVEYVLCFENRGQEIGVTLHHPHGQVYAYPFVPARIARSLESARRHRAVHGSCVFCDVVRREVSEGVRVVARSDHFVAFVPHAPRWPFEIHTYPLEHLSNLSDLEPVQLTELMVLQADVVSALDRLFDRPMPYTAGVAPGTRARRSRPQPSAGDHGVGATHRREAQVLRRERDAGGRVHQRCRPRGGGGAPARGLATRRSR